jgi:hypothetical protein
VGCVALLLTHGYGRQLRFAREHIEPLRGSPTRIVCTGLRDGDGRSIVIFAKNIIVRAILWAGIF